MLYLLTHLTEKDLTVIREINKDIKMQIKILFLDLDGVMVLEDSVRDGPFNTDMFDPECVRVLNEIIKETDCQIVLSSDWRLHFNLRQIWDIFKFNKVARFPLGFTGEATSGGGWTSVKLLEEHRGIEIKRWLGQHGLQLPFKFWVVVDDMDLSPHVSRFVRTDWERGLVTEGVKEEIIEKLNGNLA